MSLRSYLFTLIGGLIILLTIAQLFLVYWIEQTLAKEVNQKAQVLSQHVIELAFEEFEKIDLHKNQIIYSSTSKEENNRSLHDQGHIQIHVESLDNDLTHNDESDQLDVSIEPTNISKHFYTKELKTLVEKQVNRLKSSDSATLVIKTPHSENFIVFENYKNNSVNKSTVPHSANSHPIKSQNMFYYVQIALILCAIIALIFAYWLSIQFNKPLKKLVFGFENLAKGDYKYNVPETGVNEIRTTISHFNDMVKRLASLTSAEKQHKEIAHLAELGEVSRGLAHALRNPIHTIGLSLEQLSAVELSKDQRNKLIKTVQSKITNIDKNIKALLTLTTTGISRKDKIPVLAVIQDILLEYKSCQPKTQHFELDVDPTVTLTGSEAEIRSILHTLIINACEANSIAESITSIVSIKLIRQAENVINISVSDEGNGLNEKLKSQLFQPHISTKPEGAGMGLYIAKRIISLHYSGDITLTNKQDKASESNDTAESKSVTGCIAQAVFKQI
ncbi:MAG: HAMP domain-containing histidine kinase [Alteromonadaceae bacterium]|nr:HAMP domain-containing histidine kinase [Alteromonadaceae bacterium]